MLDKIAVEILHHNFCEGGRGRRKVYDGGWGLVRERQAARARAQTIK